VSPDDVRRTEDEPNDRLTRIGAAMLQTLEWHPEASGDERVIIVLTDPVARRNGTSIGGYDSDVDAALDLFEHMRALFRARGQELILAPLGGG
jgi:hypothetical protein